MNYKQWIACLCLALTIGGCATQKMRDCVKESRLRAAALDGTTKAAVRSRVACRVENDDGSERITRAEDSIDCAFLNGEPVAENEPQNNDL